MQKYYPEKITVFINILCIILFKRQIWVKFRILIIYFRKKFLICHSCQNTIFAFPLLSQVNPGNIAMQFINKQAPKTISHANNHRII